ncbi:MAG: ribosome-associated translation inhibitor RaiA [Planctomycetota bacterium]|nr:MAG: ribosome-associated translation inhibitor RaiA [Planctomycetota bacterium]
MGAALPRVSRSQGSTVQIKVACRHGHISEESQNYIKAKAEKLTHLFDRLTMIEVTVDHQKDGFWVEFLVQAEHKHDFVAHEKCDDLNSAVNAALDKAQMQLRRYKEKIQDHRRDPSTAEVAAGNPETNH